MAHKLVDYLREEIKGLIAAKNKSIRWFVLQVEMDYSVIYRLMSGERNNVSFYQAYKLLKYLRPDDYFPMLGEFFPDETKTFFPNGTPTEDIQQNQNERVYGEIFEERLLYEVFLAISCSGSTLNDIASEFGSRGLSAVDTLQEVGAIEVKEGGHIGHLIDGFILTEDSLSKKQANMNLDIIDLNVPGSTLFSDSSGLNDRGIAALFHHVQAHRKGVSEIFSNPDFKGTKPVVISTVAGSVVEKARK